MSRCEPTRSDPPARSRWGLLAASLAAVALLAATLGAGDAAAADCPSEQAQPTESSRGAIAQATLCLVNAERRERGLRPLRLDRRLSLAARSHSRDMVVKGYFSHTAPDGSSVVRRIRSSGYLRSSHRWRVGENLAWGTRMGGSPDAIVSAWMRSPPHREAILTSGYRDAGVGVARGVPTGPDDGGVTYTLDFGARR